MSRATSRWDSDVLRDLSKSETDDEKFRMQGKAHTSSTASGPPSPTGEGKVLRNLSKSETDDEKLKNQVRHTALTTRNFARQGVRQGAK